MTDQSRSTKLADGDGPPRRVAVLRALQLGDLLCAVPALRALRGGLPASEIVLIGLPWARAFVERYPAYLDGFREFPGWPGLPERRPNWGRISAFVARMRAERFDLVLQLHGSGLLTNAPARLFGGRRSAGFYPPGTVPPDPESFMPYPEEGLEVHRLLRLVEFLGYPARGDHLEFPVRDSDRQALAALEGASELEAGPYACIHPGASVPQRRWPVDRFAVVARLLAERGLRVALTGTAPEAGLAARASGVDCLNFAGRTDLGTLAALLCEARMLVCNDTGVSHLAAALRLPSMVISTGRNPSRWAPTDKGRHRVLGGDQFVPIAAVVQEVEMILTQSPPGRTTRRRMARTEGNHPDGVVHRERQPERTCGAGHGR